MTKRISEQERITMQENVQLTLLKESGMELKVQGNQ